MLDLANFAWRPERVFLPSWLFFKWVVLGQNKLKSGPALHFTTSLYSCLSEQVQAVFGISTSLTCPELRNVLLKFDTFLLSMPLCLMWFLEQYKILCCCWSNIPYKLPIWLSRWCSCVNMQKKKEEEKYSIVHYKRYRARFTNQGKLILECNSIKAPMRGDNSVGDLPTMHTLKNRWNQIISIMTSAIYQEQRKLPPASIHFFWWH